MRYINCTVTITKSNEVHYDEEDGSQTRAISGRLQRDSLRLMTINRLNYWINYAVARHQVNPTTEKLASSLDDLKALGLHLYQFLFSDERIRLEFEKAFRRVRGQCEAEPDLRLRLRLVFDPTTETLASLPWEFLLVAPEDNMDAGVFMAGMNTELLLTRRIEIPEQIRNLVPTENTLAILLIACQPDEIEGKQLDIIDEKEISEINEILKTIQGLGGTSKVTVEVRKDPSYDEVRQGLIDYKPHIVHYVGHGSEGKIALRKAKEDYDYDINRGGEQYRWITSEEVRSLFRNPPRPRLVFLSACKGASVDMVESLKSTARELVYAGVPGVVAMQTSITNANAKLFAQKFYEEIGRGKDIDEAVKMGRKALGDLYPPWRHPRFATPVVYLQNSDPFVHATASGGVEGGTSSVTARSASMTPSTTEPVAVEASRLHTDPRNQRGTAFAASEPSFTS